MSKQRVYEPLAKAMLKASGKQRYFSKEAMMKMGIPADRINPRLWDLQHYIGAEVKAVREGRKVVKYELLNPAVVKAYFAKQAAMPKE